MPGGEDQEGMEERAIESQLEIQLDEQRQSILALDEALKSDLSNLDLHSVGTSSHLFHRLILRFF